MATQLLYRSVNPWPTLLLRPLFTSCIISKHSSDSPLHQKLHILSVIPVLRSDDCDSFRAPKSRHRRCYSAKDAVVVAKDDKYGNKQVISVTSQLYEYLLSNVREPEILKKLREETATMRGSQMQVSPDQAQLLAMLVQILGAKRCIEVGVYTGYSSLAIALVLPDSGCLIACERDAKSLEIAKKYYKEAGVSHKVDVRHALAADTLKSLIVNGEACSYDFAFVDAEKKMYHEYFELLIQLVRVGGVIVIDNVLWHGKVADPLVDDAKTVSIRNFNRILMKDERVSISMLIPTSKGTANGMIQLWKVLSAYCSCWLYTSWESFQQTLFGNIQSCKEESYQETYMNNYQLYHWMYHADEDADLLVTYQGTPTKFEKGSMSKVGHGGSLTAEQFYQQS